MSEQVSRLVVVVEDKDAKAHLAKLQQELQNLKTQAEKAFSALDKSTKALSSSIQSHTNSLKAFNQQLNAAAASADKLKNVNLHSNLNAASTAAKSFIGSLSTKAIHAFSGAITGLAQHLAYLSMALGYVAAHQFIAFGKSVVEAGIYYQKFISTIQVTTGDLESARKEWQYLMEFATYAGSSIEALADPYAKLSAAAKGTALEGENLREVFEAISMASTVLHSSAQDTNLMFYAIQQMASKGVVSMEELRRQLGERLPGAMVLAAKAMGMTQAQLQALVESGKLLSEDLLPLLAREIKNQFSGGFEYAMNSTQAALNRLANAWLEAKQVIAESGFLDAITVALQVLTAKLKEAGPQLQELGQKMGEIVLRLADFVMGLSGPKMAQAFADFVGWIAVAMKDIGNFIAMIVGAQTALLGLAAAKGNLLAMAAGGAVGFGVGYGGTKLGMDAVISDMKEDAEKIRNSVKAGEESITKLKQSEYQQRMENLKQFTRFESSLYGQSAEQLKNLQKSYAEAWLKFKDSTDPVAKQNADNLLKHLQAVNYELKMQEKQARVLEKYKAYTVPKGSGGGRARAGKTEEEREGERRLKEFQRMQEEEARIVEQMKQNAVRVSQDLLDQVFPIQAIQRKMDEMRSALNWRVVMGDITSGEAAQALAEFTKQFDSSRVGQYQRQLEALEKRWKSGEMALDEYRKRLYDIRSAYQDLFPMAENITAGAQAALQDLARDTGDAFQHAYDLTKNLFDELEDVLVEFFTTGKLNVADFARYIQTEITKALVQTAIIQPLAKNAGSFFGSLMGMIFSANGNVFAPSGHVKALAAGGVVTGATPFLYNGGVGVMGEAGPEAVMPLTRTPDGKLGVKAENASNPINVNVHYVIQSGATLDPRTAQQTAAMTAKALARANQRNN